MGSTTTKGYPYPVGTDRVMDGDNAMQSLAEAIDADACYTHALPSGQSVPATTVTAFAWQAATENGCNLTKASGFAWTTTLAGLYVVTAGVIISPAQTGRAFVEVYAGNNTARTVFTGDGRAAATIVNRLIVGDTIKAEIYFTTAQSITAGATGGYLNIARVGRSTGAATPT